MQRRQTIKSSILPTFMKKTTLSVLGFSAFLSASPAYSAVLLRYDMAVVTPTTQDAVNGAGGGSLTRGAGLSSFVINDSPGSYTTVPVLRVNPNNGNTTATDAFTNSSFFSFSLTVGSNVSDLDLTSISFDAARGGGSTPRGFAIRVDTPTTADQVVRTAQDVDTVRATFTNYSTTLNGFTSLQNLVAGNVVTFEIAVYSPNDGNSLEFDNLIVNGDVTPIPEPSTVAIAGLGLVVLGFRRRRA